MNTDEILRRVFGASSVIEHTTEPKEDHLATTRSSHILTRVNDYIRKSLLNYTESRNSDDNRQGRIGPNIVGFDTSLHHGPCIVSPDRLSVNSQCNFSTMRANTAVFRGKWMYEVQLGSKGVMQVGWGTAQCKFNQQFGVGDTINSYAYDGNRMRKWNVTTHKYGESWLTGDIIGCALDMDDGTIDFYRNGRSLGRAFENVPMGAGIAYLPTVSLAFTENLTANFGSIPFRYPVKGYQPLQASPAAQVLQATLLFQWLSQVIELLEQLKNTDEQKNVLFEEKTMSTQAFLMCLARSILKRIGPLLTIPYITEAVFVPFLQALCNLNDCTLTKSSNYHSAKPTICLDLLWTFLEEQEIKMCLENTVLHLLCTFRHVTRLLEYPDQCKSLMLLTRICQHTLTRQHLLQYLLFDRVRFANFVHVKPLDEGGLAGVVEKVWWKTNPLDPAIEANKADYLYACERIKAAISEVEALQVELLVTLLNNTDGTAKRPASRTIFLRKFKRFINENLISSRTPLPITLCCFHRLLVAFRILWDTEIGTSPVYVPCRAFYDASINYTGIDRLGGVITHLNKTFKNELLRLLGPDHEVIVAMEQMTEAQQAPNAYAAIGAAARLADLPAAIPAYSRLININSPSQGSSMILERLGFFSHSREDRTPIRHGPADPAVSLLELLDGIVMFYHVAAKKQLAKVANLRDNMAEYINAIADTKARLDLVKKGTDATQRELHHTIGVFGTKLSEQARHMAWIRAVVYTEEKQAQLAWLLRMVTLTLQTASQQGNMLSFVPDFYLEALANLCVTLRNHVHPTVPIENIQDHRELLLNAADFLCNHFLDPRIVHANSKDMLILTLAGFVSNPLTLEALENVPRDSRIKVVTNLLKPYENRAWAQSNWVLVRFWQGNGFAFRYEKSPHLSKKVGPKLLQQESISQPIKPCPSAVYQAHVRDVLLENPQATTQFLNSLLNQLNWAFSEFIGMVQEIHNVSSRPERVFIESRQLKICATCFDLAISLLRVLEMISTVALSVFNDPAQSSSETLLARLCQLLCQVLNRMSSQTSCFQHVVLLEIPDLESVDHFPILAAVIGILLALLEKEMSIFAAKPTVEVPKITRSLLTEPSFQTSSLYFVLADAKNTKAKNVKPFSLSNYKEDVTVGEIERVKEMIKYLDTCRTLLPESKMISDDDDTCTICYAFPIAATFKPCNHQTCRTCIDRHLLNARECFFCKATIDRVEDLSGNMLHDFTDEFATSKATS
ncbi:PREDICTED: E3 ubiquitin-protein ligase RNF123-like [Dinoponera quadriceps]|uniref:RING-type E3 ubiquitin transferase n=1 Tax=Dinoponera quadriceps TaxID=609295 RepID=A0A6P3WSI1_DINQU|nr:PREDICTED: E3 ubiquitin-protein ligase RNF123-like [Dinoponera quadriceps]